jgi:hypothetical protein
MVEANLDVVLFCWLDLSRRLSLTGSHHPGSLGSRGLESGLEASQGLCSDFVSPPASCWASQRL